MYKGRIYVSGGFKSKQFYAFNATTGRLDWGVNLGDDGPSAPACDDDVCVFNTESCTLFSLDAKTGKKLWSWYLGDPQLSAPTVAHGRVFSAYPAKWTNKKPPRATHVLGAFDLRTGKVLWQRWIDGDVMSAPVAAGKELYVTSFAGTVYKFDQSSGKILSAERARATSAPLIVANDVSREDAGFANEGNSDEIVGAHLARNLHLWKEKRVVRNAVLRRESGKNVESESRDPRGGEYAADGSGRPIGIAGG